MTNADSLRRRLLALPTAMLFVEVQLVMEDAGFIARPGRGSHFKFSRADRVPVVITIHDKKVSQTYLRNCRKALLADEA